MTRNTIIVDENDNPIGSKESMSVESEDIYRVSALWLTNSKGEVLMARRSWDKKNDPGKWGPAVAGTIEEGETYDENIVKECKEELGLDITPEKGPKKRVTGKHNYFCQWYTIILDKDLDEFQVQEEEVAEIKWFTKEELRNDVEKNPDEFTPNTITWVTLFL